MRNVQVSLAVLLTFASLNIFSVTAKADEGPTDPKARKTYEEANDFVRKHMIPAALDNFKKADKQDGGHCEVCQKKMIKYAVQLHEWKVAETASEELVAEAQEPQRVAIAHYQFGIVLLDEGMDRHKEEFFRRSHEEFTKALAASAKFPAALFADGRALAYLKQDDAAKACFEKFAQLEPEDKPEHQRALRYLSQPELARARMAPAFEVTTADGQQISLDGLQGKVVLIDFWATWCGPCRAALPHVREIAHKFEGQPLVVLSISVDNDETKWKEFIAKNEMTWPQYFDGGFGGPIAKSFGVGAIPNTFTIDADGVLQDEHIGDAAIEGKLKKLVNRAKELQAAQKTAQ